MKLTHLICLSIATAVSTQAFALEIYKGKVTNHKEWSTGGAKGSFVADFGHGNSLKTRGNANNNNASTDEFASLIVAHALSGTTNANELTALPSYNSVFYANHTNENQSYTYMFGACGQDSKNVVQCLFSEKTIELEPQGYFEDSTHPTFDMTWTKPGRYLIESVTQTLEPNFKHGLSTSVATMVVS